VHFFGGRHEWVPWGGNDARAVGRGDEWAMSDHIKGQERWHAVRTRARYEKIVARALTDQGLTCLLPLRTEEQTYAGVTVEVTVPIVAGCVFVRGNDAVGFQAALTNGVREVTGVTVELLVQLPPEVRAVLIKGGHPTGGTARPPGDETPPAGEVGLK
jgi:hypothetical protein